ncbi:hypothetical protein [Pseudophaeobacter sp.]|uniref:hypothetical protein n=1 Tax=Pseudophaeobacter sp. TaxID=1971739 RepID=UPI004057FA57
MPIEIDPTRAEGEDKRVFFLSTEQHDNIAAWLNKKIDIPFLPDGKELKILRKIVIAVDRNLMKVIPSEYLDGAHDKTFELEDAVADALKEYAVPALLEAIPLPFLRRTLQRKVVNKLVDLLVDAIAEKTTLDEKIEAVINGV